MLRALATLFVASAALGGATVGGVIAITLGPGGLLHRLRHLEQLAFTDPLTGLANRRLLDIIDATQRIAVSGRVWAVMGDLDSFKAVNDRHGHPAGDALLQSVAGILRTHTRPGDFVLRLGGDEFALVLWSCSISEAEAVLSRIQRRVHELSPACSISFGVCAVRPTLPDERAVSGPVTRTVVVAALADADLALMGERRNRQGRRSVLVVQD